MKPFYDASGSWINKKRVIGLLSLEAGLILKNHRVSGSGMGPSIKYVTLFLANFYPLPPPVTLRHTSRDPPKLRHTSRTPRFLEGLVQKTRTKAPLYKFCLNCSRGFFSGGFCQGVFYLEG